MPKTTKRLSFLERENLILKTAEQLFSKNGYNGTTTKAVALKAKINEALIFKHFKTKEEMYSALLQKKLNEKGKKLTALNFLLNASKQHNRENELIVLANFIVSENKIDPHCLRMMTFSALENHILGKKFFQQKLPLVDFIETYFLAKLSAAEKKKNKPKLVARMFLSLIYHYIYITQIFKAQDFYQDSEKNVIANFCRIFSQGLKV